MKITINGEEKSFEAPLNLHDILVQEGVAEMMIAVARNGNVVPRSQYGATNVSDGDLIEIVSPMQGG